MDLWSSVNSDEPRYTLRTVDLPRRKATNGLFAIFLVPQGRQENSKGIMVYITFLGKQTGSSQPIQVVTS